MQIFYAMLPIILVAVTLVIDVILGTRKVWLVSLLVLICVLFLQYPDIAASYGLTPVFADSTVAVTSQIILLLLWFMILLGGSRIVGFANPRNAIPRVVGVLLAVLSIGFSSGLTWMIFTQEDSIRSKVLGTLGLSILIFFVILRLLYRVICPLFVLKKETCISSLTDYGRVFKFATGKPLNFRDYNFVRFENDPEEYMISLFVFQKIKGMVNSVYSYRKCHCILGVTYIDRLNLVTEHPKQLSIWGENAERPVYRKQTKLGIAALLFIVIVLVVLFAFIFIQAG